MKSLKFVDSSHSDLNRMPADVRHTLGVELMRVQFGGEPQNFKPMKTVGAGACEITCTRCQRGFPRGRRRQVR